MTGARGRVRAAFLLPAICAVLVGCGTLERERVVLPAAVRDSIQSQLGVALAETPPANEVAALTDVSAVYTWRSTEEQLLVVVFSSRDATVQFTGGTQPSGSGVIVIGNVVAVYEHDRGTASRRRQLLTSLRRLTAERV